MGRPGHRFPALAVLAERLRRTLKARVRKSVGSIPTDCKFIFVSFFPLSKFLVVVVYRESLLLDRGLWSLARCSSGSPEYPGIAQLAERETVDGYN